MRAFIIVSCAAALLAILSLGTNTTPPVAASAPFVVDETRPVVKPKPAPKVPVAPAAPVCDENGCQLSGSSGSSVSLPGQPVRKVAVVVKKTAKVGARVVTAPVRFFRNGGFFRRGGC